MPMLARPIAHLPVISLLAASVLLAGCYPGYRTGGNRKTDDTFTYVSQPFQPLTITLVDTRTDEILFTREIPVGQQLTIKFVDGDGGSNPSMPDLMKFELFDDQTTFARLSEGIPVPPAHSRRIDVEVRDGPELRG